MKCVEKPHNLCPPSLRDAPTHTQSVQGRLGDFSPQSISNLITALCKLRVTAQPEWMSAAVNQLHKSKEPAGPQATANVLWALAKMGYSFNTQGLDAMVSLVARRLPAFQPSQQSSSSDLSTISSGSSLPSSDRQSYNTQVGFHMHLSAVHFRAGLQASSNLVAKACELFRFFCEGLCCFKCTVCVPADYVP